MHPLELLYERLTGAKPEYDNLFRPLIEGEIDARKADVATASLRSAVWQLVKERGTERIELVVDYGSEGFVYKSVLDLLEGTMNDIIPPSLASWLAKTLESGEPYTAATEFPILPQPYSAPA